MEENRGLPRRERNAAQIFGCLPAPPLRRALGRLRKNLGLPVSRFAFRRAWARPQRPCNLEPGGSRHPDLTHDSAKRAALGGGAALLLAVSGVCDRSHRTRRRRARLSRVVRPQREEARQRRIPPMAARRAAECRYHLQVSRWPTVRGEGAISSESRADAGAMVLARTQARQAAA